MANRNFIPPPPPTLMKAFVDGHAEKPSDDDFKGGADDHRGGLLGGTTVVLSGCSVGIKYGDYSEEDQCDEADDDEVAPRSVSKGDRMRKVGKRAYAKRGCFSGKHGFRV